MPEADPTPRLVGTQARLEKQRRESKSKEKTQSWVGREERVGMGEVRRVNVIKIHSNPQGIDKILL